MSDKPITKVPSSVMVDVAQLRAVLFWAAVGVSSHRAGSYENRIQAAIEDMRLKIKMTPAEFSTYPVYFKGPKKVKSKP